MRAKAATGAWPYNVGEGGYWRRLWNVIVSAIAHPTPVTRHVCRQIVKRRARRILRWQMP